MKVFSFLLFTRVTQIAIHNLYVTEIIVNKLEFFIHLHKRTRLQVRLHVRTQLNATRAVDLLSDGQQGSM